MVASITVNWRLEGKLPENYTTLYRNKTLADVSLFV